MADIVCVRNCTLTGIVIAGATRNIGVIENTGDSAEWDEFTNSTNTQTMTVGDPVTACREWVGISSDLVTKQRFVFNDLFSGQQCKIRIYPAFVSSAYTYTANIQSGTGTINTGATYAGVLGHGPHSNWDIEFIATSSSVTIEVGNGAASGTAYMYFDAIDFDMADPVCQSVTTVKPYSMILRECFTTADSFVASPYPSGHTAINHRIANSVGTAWAYKIQDDVGDTDNASFNSNGNERFTAYTIALSPLALDYDEDTDGGFSVGGDVVETLTFFGVGGFAVGGAVDPVASYTMSVDGGVALGGTVTPIVSHVETVSGGFAIGGSVTATVEISVGGGFAFGGSVAPVMSYTITPDGGLVLGGAVNVVGPVPVGGGIKIGAARFANGYRYRQKITIPASDIKLKAFPVIINASVPDHRISGRGDFRFEDASGNELYRDFRSEFSDNCYKQVVRLDLGEEQEIYMYYGENE